VSLSGSIAGTIVRLSTKPAGREQLHRQRTLIQH
jgi:hypothetical protein